MCVWRNSQNVTLDSASVSEFIPFKKKEIIFNCDASAT